MHTSRLEAYAFVKQKENRIVRPSPGFSHDRRSETKPPPTPPTANYQPRSAVLHVHAESPTGRPAQIAVPKEKN
jgi:hypothetical protein